MPQGSYKKVSFRKVRPVLAFVHNAGTEKKARSVSFVWSFCYFVLWEGPAVMRGLEPLLLLAYNYCFVIIIRGRIAKRLGARWLPQQLGGCTAWLLLGLSMGFYGSILSR